MRQSQQKARARSRGGRKQQNPLNRNFESNGPDVKIRGNASHIAEKYSSLARDALSNGDSVMAENYLQHAEHYNRIIASAQAAQQQQQEGRQDRRQNAAQPDGEQPTTEPFEETENTAAANPQPEEEESRPRRGRPRRARRNEKADGGDRKEEVSLEVVSNGATSDEQPARQASEDEPKEVRKPRRGRRPKAEAISDDAAMLPESITGGAG